MELHRALRLAQTLMEQHGLLNNGWTFDWDRSKRRAGCCHHTHKKITLSESITQLNDDNFVRDTLLHEIAHALAGFSAHHGYQWQFMCRKIGCEPERLHSGVVEKPQFVGTCPNCRKQVFRHRRKNIACSRCCNAYNGGRWDAKYQFVWGHVSLLKA
jgi:predicted SprT family Zn-dependent metalloprotease